MERAISEMEKIRRAEEIYSRRKNLKNELLDKEPRNVYKSLFQFILLVNIAIIIISIQNKDYIFTQSFINQINTYNVNIKSKIEKWFYDKEKINPQTNEQNVDKTDVNSGDNSVSGEVNDVHGALVENNDKLLEGERNVIASIEEKNEELSQMEIDSMLIKEKYSIINPIEGTKTSGFGERISNNSKVTGFHTGVDISAVKGTVIKSATSGIVTQVSEVGDYGKHLKIETDKLTILYAHCSKIYVSEGDEIKQGQSIGEVGSTGNSTGPHLHFEIRYEERFVDPELIITI